MPIQTLKYLCLKLRNSILGYVVLLCSFALATTSNVFAAEGVVDKFKISLGGYSLARYESTMSLTDVGTGAGVSIDPQETLGVQNERTVLRLDGYYRFNNEHSLTYSWYSISSHGYKALEKEIEWVDEDGNPITIPIGASVNSILDYDIYKIGYLWSFYKTDKVELTAGAGLHIAKLTVGLTTSTTSSGIDAQNVSTSLPLPVLSFGISYHVTPSFQWYLKSEFFALKFDKYDGTYTDSTLGMEYRAFDNVGLGIGFGSNSLKLIEKTDDYKFQFDNRISGLSLYVAAYF